MIRKLCTLVLVSVVTLVMTACPNTPYGKAVSLGLNVTDVLHTAADSADKLRLAGEITKDEEKSVQKYFDALNNLDVNVYGPCIQAAHAAKDKASGFAGCAQSLSNSVSDPALLAQFDIKNPQSQAKVSQVSQAISNLIQTALLGLNDFSAQGK